MPDHLEVPEEAVERVMDRRNVREQEDRILSPLAAVRDDLAAAAPAIREQERQRVWEALLNHESLDALFGGEWGEEDVQPLREILDALGAPDA